MLRNDKEIGEVAQDMPWTWIRLEKGIAEPHHANW